MKFTSRIGLLLATVLMIGFSSCMPGSANSNTTISTGTPTLTALPRPRASRTATRQPLETTSTPTLSVPPVPDDKRIRASIDVGSAPWTMAVAHGYLWVIAGNSIVRIDPHTDQVVGKPIPVHVPEKAGLEAIAVDQDSLWVSIVGWGNISARNDIDSILRIDPETGETLATIQVRRGPMSLTLTPGRVWTVNWGANLVSRIDSKTNQLAEEPFRTGRGPYSITFGAGSVWVMHHDSMTLTRIDPETNQVIADIRLAQEPHRVTFGEGSLWIGNWHDLSVSRIDPQTNQVVGDPIPIGYAAGNIAAGYGNVWVTSDYRGTQAFPEAFPDHVVLIRIDPKTNTVIDTIPLGGHPVDVEVTENAVWVSIQHPDRILKIRP